MLVIIYYDIFNNTKGQWEVPGFTSDNLVSMKNVFVSSYWDLWAM